MEEYAIATPTVERGLCSRFAVDVYQYRVFLGTIKVGRLNHPAIYRHTIAGISFEELYGRCKKLRNPFLVFGTVAARTYDLVIWKRHQFAQPGIIDARETVIGVFPVG